jgi:hypothetical protein
MSRPKEEPVARFVVLEHDFPELHWDLMLECGAVLRTWRLSSPPLRGQILAAEKSFDHRPLYLDYEGPIGGQRGRVKRWDGGSFRWEKHEATDPQAAGSLVFEGERLRGSAILEPASSGEWQLRLEKSTSQFADGMIAPG